MTDDLDLDALAEELAEFAPKEKKAGRSPREERIIAGFEDIQRFVDEHGHAPRHGEHLDIFERLYAVRLDRLRDQPDCRAILEPLDRQGVLRAKRQPDTVSDAELDTDALLAELESALGKSDITELRHVRTAEEKRAAEEVAAREKCEDFARFKPLFDQVAIDLKTGERESRIIRKAAGLLKTDIKKGEFFVLDGLTVYVAEVGDPQKAPNGENDARIRAIFSNGTESRMLLRSLVRALHKDEASRRITARGSAGPLFNNEEASPFIGQLEEEDTASGTIYVLRSKSEHPVVAANRDVLHKIGVTGGDVQRRIANAKLDATFLLADVEVVATYTLYNINRTKLENLIHRIFEPARLDIEIKDRFGNPVTPREWFLVPRFVIDDAVERIKNGTITNYTYCPAIAQLRLNETRGTA
jgi:hypothetical protein